MRSLDEKYKIAPNVICCPSKFGVLYDKEKEYSKEQWEEDEAEKYVKDGFLIKAKVKEKKITVM